MKRQEVEAIIPVALQELHDAGFARVYVDQLGQQITRHETDYLEKRATLRRALGYIGVHIAELPGGHFRPGAYKMYRSLTELEEAGIVKGEFEESLGGAPPRRQYFLVEQTD
jgi:hypothetical protein